ncbi:MAG: hypothetical protein M3511_07365 [Deinococcota bacterium]|jgi:type III secretory pathway component EscV|nr:hypothetical protein [Deinococcota bacterium]
MKAKLLHYALVLAAALLLALVLLPVIGTVVFALFWVAVGVGVGAFLMYRRHQKNKL